MTKILPKFEALGISDATLAMLAKKWFEEPSPIQEQTIPLLLKGGINVIGQAATGTGKTAAFGIPLAEKIIEHKKHVQAMVLAPTRELAIQVAEEVKSFVANKKVNVVTIYGGQSYTIQNRALKKGADIIIGTPGRIIDHINKGRIVLDNLDYFVLDEADEMLNMGFLDDIKRILESAEPPKNMLFFSATMPSAITKVAKKFMGEYEHVAVKNKAMTTNNTDQIYFEVHHNDRFEALSRIIDIEPEFYGIIFCRTKVDVEKVSGQLRWRGYDVSFIHGDIQQRSREKILKDFKSKKLIALVATDVAARGIDVQGVTHVVNYSLPQDPESYVHRIGRTWRAGNKGVAITFVTPDEYRRLIFFKRATKADITKADIPDASKIIEAKKLTLNNELDMIIEADKYSSHVDFAKELLEKWSPDQLVASLLAHAYKHEFSEERYAPLREVAIDTAGTTRLFIALGRNSGYHSPKKLAEYVAEVAEVNEKQLKNITILDDFSFVTTGFEEAEAVLHAFGKLKKKGQKPLVTKAKERKWVWRWGYGGGRGRWWNRGYWSRWWDRRGGNRWGSRGWSRWGRRFSRRD